MAGPRPQGAPGLLRPYGSEPDVLLTAGGSGELLPSLASLAGAGFGGAPGGAADEGPEDVAARDW
jgi:hypothetical protein